MVKEGVGYIALIEETSVILEGRRSVKMGKGVCVEELL